MNTGHALCTCIGTTPRHIKINFKKKGRRQTLAHLDSIYNLPMVGGFTLSSAQVWGQLLFCLPMPFPTPHLSHFPNRQEKVREWVPGARGQPNPATSGKERREKGGWGAEELRKGLTAGEHAGSRG